MNSKKVIIEALRKNGGFVSRAAESLHLTPKAIYKRIETDPEVREAWNDIKEMYLDLAESKVVSAINKGAPWAICFMLKCHGKNRGWIETQRHEVMGENGGAVKVETRQMDLTKLTKDELTALHKLHAKMSGANTTD
jgi:hypothetical protein